jgi:hypothetical protein
MATTNTPRSAALRYASVRLHLSGLRSVVVDRSRIQPAWALVSGSYGSPSPGGIWAIWLQQHAGRWLVRFASVDGRHQPKGTQVPCDIWPAFSEPACRHG